MNKKDEALKLALDAVEWMNGDTRPTPSRPFKEIAQTIREALAEQPAPSSHLTDEQKAANGLAWLARLEAMREEFAGLVEQPAQQQEPVQTTPNFAQLKQILDNLDRCHHMDSKREFLRTWIRDWTEHKLAKHIQPAQQQEQKLEFVSPGGGYVPAIPRSIPLDWKLVPRKATPEMLRAMDECAQEGYDECFYEGMASSVYMAAWDASPVMGTLPEQPAQQQELQTCNCRWDGDIQVQQCTLHEAHVDAIHEWAERAKIAQAVLEKLLNEREKQKPEVWMDANDDVFFTEADAYKTGITPIRGLYTYPPARQQEPVADVNVRPSPHGGCGIASVLSHKLPVGSWLLYTSPPARKPLVSAKDAWMKRKRETFPKDYDESRFANWAENYRHEFMRGWNACALDHGIMSVPDGKGDA